MIPKQKITSKKATRLNLFVLLMLFAFGSVPAFATDATGEILIDGEPVPPSVFDYYRLWKEIVDRACVIPATKEKTIDLIVAALRYDQEFGRTNNNDRSVIGDLQHAFSGITDETKYKKIRDGFDAISDYQRALFKQANLRARALDIHDEYQKRVRDKDPHITNLTIARVLEINQPGVRDWDEAIVEIATAIKEGMPFEEAMALYPQDKFETRYQEDAWVALHSLPLDIDKNTVKVGDVYGVEDILSFNKIYVPIIKILELKVLPQVRRSDKIYIDRRPTRNPDYLDAYLYEKATERKKHLYMSELWANHTITEDGKPIVRVGLHKPCDL